MESRGGGFTSHDTNPRISTEGPTIYERTRGRLLRENVNWYDHRPADSTTHNSPRTSSSAPIAYSLVINSQSRRVVWQKARARLEGSDDRYRVARVEMIYFAGPTEPPLCSFPNRNYRLHELGFANARPLPINLRTQNPFPRLSD